ncbi:MAG: MobF family relaxase [Sporichthyaceae bacterium]
MSLARLSAGSGYKYLLRHTACGDACREPGTPLTAYYAASGYPAGRWLGAGLAGVDAGNGIAVGTVVTEEAMAALYGSGHDPVSGKALGMPYPTYKSADERIAEELAGLPDTLATDELAAQRAEIEKVERARPVRAAVAGFDLTFTVPKSASVLWALGDEATQRAVVDAHREAVTAVLGLVEQRFLHTRVGAQGCAQVATAGMLAAAFDHWDTRTGDPNLHTHVVIANKVQGPDGKWRSLDSRALHHAAVACSEVYDDLLADALATRLPVSWSWRSRGERRSPAFEIDGLDDNLLRAFSGRSAQIETHVRELVTDFVSRYDREPSRREILRLRQQATLATRPDKTVQPLRELFTRWRGTASTLTGQSPDAVVARALRPGASGSAIVEDNAVTELAGVVLYAVTERRSTWTRPNLLAEAARATRHLRTAAPDARVALLDRVVTATLDRCVALDPPAMFSTPRRFQRADASSAFTRPDEHAFTTAAVLDAEARLLAAGEDITGPRIDAAAVKAVLARIARPMPGRRDLTEDQQQAVVSIAASARRLDVLVGPAGSGKTRTLRALRTTWESAMGQGSVVGLAASSTAAAELAAALGITCENTAKWLHDNGSDLTRGTATLQPGQLVIVDEASMVATADLDRILNQAGQAGAKVLLVGDHHQLGAVGAGGGFALLAETPHTQSLTGLWRFRQRWEADATRALRDGKVSAVDNYAEHGRIHDGPSELMLDHAYTAWAADVAAGRSSLLLAADRATVNALNTRAQEDRVGAGLVQPDGIPLADEAAAGRGDIVVTRRNDRRLHTADGGYVRNGALWMITDIHPDGALDVTATGIAHGPTGSATVRLPAAYVREHVELGYAATVHRAQGMTVDHGHLLATDTMTRQTLYVAMTRGRQSNHAYVAVDGIDPTCSDPTAPEVPTGRHVLAKVLATDGAELSATTTLRRRQTEATSLRHLFPIRETLARSGAPGDTDGDRALAEVQALISARSATLRDQFRNPGSRSVSTAGPRRPRPEGIQR